MHASAIYDHPARIFSYADPKQDPEIDPWIGRYKNRNLFKSFDPSHKCFLTFTLRSFHPSENLFFHYFKFIERKIFKDTFYLRFCRGIVRFLQ